MNNAQIFLKVWMREKWGIEAGLLAFPEMKLDLTLEQVCEAMESYKDYCLKVTPECAFCGNSPSECECPQPL